MLKKLRSKKYRDKLGFFVVENFKIIKDAKVVPEIIFSVDKKILAGLDAKNKCLIDKKINKSVSNLDTPSGVVALYKKQKNVEFKIRMSKNKDEKKLLLNSYNEILKLNTKI